MLSPVSNAVTVIMVRHGQTEWNRFERFRGRADIPLNEVGLAQADATGRRIAAMWQPQAVYSSPLSRAVKTAEIIASYCGLPVCTHPGLIDIDYGQWQGLTHDEVKVRWPAELESWYNTPHRVRIPEGETLALIRRRAMKTIHEVCTSHMRGVSIVVVSHTVINRIVLLGILGLKNECFWKLHQDTCSINCFVFDGKKFILTLMNDTCHMRELLYTKRRETMEKGQIH